MTEAQEKEDEVKKTEPKYRLIDLVNPSDLLQMGMLCEEGLLQQYNKEKELTLNHNTSKIRKTITQPEFNKKLRKYAKKEI